MEVNDFAANGERVDRTPISAGVVVPYLAYLQVPLVDVWSGHTEARVINDPPIVVRQRHGIDVQPSHLTETYKKLNPNCCQQTRFLGSRCLNNQSRAGAAAKLSAHARSAPDPIWIWRTASWQQRTKGGKCVKSKRLPVVLKRFRWMYLTCDHRISLSIDFSWSYLRQNHGYHQKACQNYFGFDLATGSWLRNEDLVMFIFPICFSTITLW